MVMVCLLTLISLSNCRDDSDSFPLGGIIGAAVGGGVLLLVVLLCLCGCVCYYRRKSRSKTEVQLSVSPIH